MQPRRSSHLLATPLLGAALLLAAAARADQLPTGERSNSLVVNQRGGLPIILSAPHGGRGKVPNVAAREGEGVPRFKTLSDANTGRLAEMLADAIEKQLGKRPYVVIARFHRKYIDANRTRRWAYESKNAQAAYDAYHEALSKAREDVIARWGRGVLLDIHGQAAEPKMIIRGTQNGKTTSHLVRRFGLEALRGETSFFGRLAQQGFPIIPAVGSPDREHPAYDGGYIVTHYGSGGGGTLDAIQLELGRELRSLEALPTTAKKLAAATAAFAKEYLPAAQDSP